MSSKKFDPKLCNDENTKTLSAVLKNLFWSQPEDGFMEKPKHVAVYDF